MSSLADKLKGLLEECERATPGPWVNEDYRDKGDWRSTGLIWSFDEELNRYFKTICRIEQSKLSSVSSDTDVETFEANAKFITSARTQLPAALRALVGVVERLLLLRNYAIQHDKHGMVEMTTTALAEIEKEFE
jgi:hypothetical protein